MDGFNDCKKRHNMTMASSFDIDDRSKLFFKFENHFPVWIYAFEVVLSSGKVLRIQSNEVSRYNNSFECSNQHGVISTRCCSSLIEAKDKCRERNMTLSKINSQTIKTFAQNLYLNATIWAIVLDASAFLKESDSLKARCLLWDKKGLRTDECTNTHKTLCIQGDYQAVIQYVGNEKIPKYSPTVTTRNYSSKSPGTSTKQDSENADQSTTDKSSTNEVPIDLGEQLNEEGNGESSNGMLIGVIIGLCLALAVLVIITTILIRKKGSNAQAKNETDQTGHGSNSSQPRLNTNIENAMYESLNDSTRTDQSNTENVAYETLDNSRLTDGPNIVNEMYENADCSKLKERSKTLNAMYETLDDTTRTGQSNTGNVAYETLDNSRRSSGSNIVNDMYENANSSKSSGRSKTLNAMYETLDHSKRIGSASEEAYSILTERNEQHMSGMNMKD